LGAAWYGDDVPAVLLCELVAAFKVAAFTEPATKPSEVTEHPAEDGGASDARQGHGGDE